MKPSRYAWSPLCLFHSLIAEESDETHPLKLYHHRSTFIADHPHTCKPTLTNCTYTNHTRNTTLLNPKAPFRLILT